MDFHERLVAEVEKLDGVARVRLMPRGKSAETRGFRRHPHLAITLINGKTFEHTVKHRPRDTWRRFLNYLCAIRRRVRESLGSPWPVTSIPATPRRRMVRKASRNRLRAKSITRPSPTVSPREPTRLDLDPWAPLRVLVIN